jgi:hypothetical protein
MTRERELRFGAITSSTGRSPPVAVRRDDVSLPPSLVNLRETGRVSGEDRPRCAPRFFWWSIVVRTCLWTTRCVS